MSTDSQFSSTGIAIQCVRVRNFRCLRQVEVTLTPLTVLIGENNSGKTSFLEALSAALGTGGRHLSEEDIYITRSESTPPKDREVVVDLLIRPTDSSGDVIDAFPMGSPWLELWGNGIVQDGQDNDFVALRMLMSWDRIKGDYFIQRRFLRAWPENLSDMMDAAVAQQLTQVAAYQLAPLALYLLDAKRDAAEEMRTRGSLWNKLTADHGLSEEDIDEIEAQLNEINTLLVSKSGVLTHVQEHLNHVSSIINCDKDNIAVNPVARRLRDLSRGIDIVLSTKDAPQFPLSRQGMGTRSLASVLLFRAYMTWRQSQQASEALHPFVAIEEPETHLHPQAQRALFHQLQGIPGQRIVSTHSPYVCSQADISSFVHFFKDGNSTVTSRFYKPGSSVLDSESIRKINRQVMNTRGDILFSRCIVLFEGETEEQAFPAIAASHWGLHPNEVGISFVSVGGSGNYLPFLRLATSFRIPWVIVSDGESAAIAALDNALSQVNEYPSASHSRCFVFDGGQCFEEYLVTKDTLPALQGMIANYIIEATGVSVAKGIEGIRQTWQKKTEAEVVTEMKAHKTTYGARIADALATIETLEHRVPTLLKNAFDAAYAPIRSPEAGD
jgi:putative ATP-dependent endonuclease of OLD family